MSVTGGELTGCGSQILAETSGVGPAMDKAVLSAQVCQVRAMPGTGERFSILCLQHLFQVAEDCVLTSTYLWKASGEHLCFVQVGVRLTKEAVRLS